MLSVKVVGIMLVSALLILPAVTALQISRKFKITLMLAGIVSLVSVVLGIVVSYGLNIPPGATIVMLNAVFFVLALTYKNCCV